MNAKQLSMNYAKLRALHAMFMFMKTNDQTEFPVQLVIPSAPQFQLQLSSKTLVSVISEQFVKLDAELNAEGIELDEFFGEINAEIEQSLAASRQNAS